MRVGYLTYGLDRAPGGTARYAVALIEALAALPQAPELVLLTTEATDSHGLWKRFARQALPGCRLLPALMTIGNLALRVAAARHRLDLVHDPNGIAPFLALPPATRRIVTIHDAIPLVHPETHNRIDIWRYRFMLPYSARRSDLVLTDSDQSGRDIVRHLRVPENKLRVIPLGIEARFSPVDDLAVRRRVLDRYSITRPYLLYIGGINARKNVARLLEAYARVRQDYPDLCLVIGGQRQWKTGAIDTAIERLALADDVHFTGYLNDADLPALYSAAKAFVWPSLYEGFGIPPLEAMACGTPTITSNSSSLPEVVGDAALMVDPYDVTALAQAIARVLTDGALRADLRRRGRNRAAQFTWERTARATLAAYEEALR